MSVTILTSLGVFIIIFGLGFIFYPQVIKRLNEIGNTIIFTTEKTIVYRYFTGVLLIIISLLLVYILLKIY